MSDRLINADKLMETIKNHHYLLIDKLNSTDYGMFTVGIQQAVDEQPTVDAELVRHGHWINKGYYAICSECGANSGTQYNGLEPIPRWSRYCPDCGAKMIEGEDDFVDPYMYPCTMCEDFNGKSGCLSHGGCGERREND